MTAELLLTLQIWKNPVFLRFWRSRLRLRKAIFWYLLTLIVTTFVVSIVYIGRTNFLTSSQIAARGLWIPLLIIQGLILMVKGTGSVSAGLIQDRIDETLDYQRLTPVPPLRSLAGYLFGLPVLEYLMFALTLPHLLFIVVVGHIPLTAVLSVYLAFFVCVMLYHTTALAAGMVMRRWFLGYIVGILLVMLVNVILPLFISQLGLKFFQFLSVWPVIGDHVLPLTAAGAAIARIYAQNPYFSMATDVPFFTWSLSPLLFTLMLQGILLVTFATMALRRWKSSTRHSLSKPYALGFLGAYIVVLLGNVWPIITRRSMPFALFGETNFDRLGEIIAVALPLVYVLVTWALCFVLFAIAVPSRHSYVRGIRRALKHGNTAARPWDDDAGGLPFIVVTSAVALAGFGLLFREIAASGFLENFQAPAFWRLPLAFGLVVLYSGLVVQVLELKPTVLVILLVGLLPILVAIVFAAAQEDVGYPQAVIASLSPLALVLASGALPIAGVVDEQIDRELSIALTGLNTGLVFIVLQIAYLCFRWYRQKRTDYAACRSIIVPNRGGTLAPETSAT